MGLKLDQKHLDAIRRHGAKDYPAECCGVLLGLDAEGVKRVRDVVPLKNLRHDRMRAEALLPLGAPERESERNRFLIDRAEIRRVEEAARSRGLDIVGYYHSHPDHPARPSDYDREHAWPWLSYVIIRVQAGEPCEHSSWVLADDRLSFRSEEVEVVGGEPGEKISTDARSQRRHPSR